MSSLLETPLPSPKKIIQRETEQMKQMACPDGIPAVPRNKKLTEFCSEPYCGQKKCSEFRTVEQKQKQTLGIPFRTISRKRKQLGILFRGTKIEATVPNLFREIFSEKNSVSNLSEYRNFPSRLEEK
jgi:hypothetical protein